MKIIDIKKFVRYVIIALLLVAIVQTAWNYAIVPAVGANRIDFFQAVGVFVFCSILFQNWNISK